MAAARAAGYVNAGTVEFLLDPGGRFYFLEMNTRLQVEHPVTESILGLDLVRLQIEVAAGRPLPSRRPTSPAAAMRWSAACTPRTRGATTFPRPGASCTCAPPEGPGIRFDGGIATGSEVSTHYDPLLAKVITWGRDRTESIERMADALARTAVLGVTTNLALLRAIVAHPAFVAGALHTGFLDDHLAGPAAPGMPAAAHPLRGAGRVAPPRRRRRAGPARRCPIRGQQAGAWRLGA